MKNRKKSIQNGINLVLIVLLVVGVVGFVVNNGTDVILPSSEIVLSCSGDVLEGEDMVFSIDSIKTPIKISVKKTNILGDAKTPDFDIKVITNWGDDNYMDYSVDGTIYSFGDDYDYTSYFNIDKIDDGFTLGCIYPDLTSLLSVIHGSDSVEVIKDVQVPFYIIVSSNEVSGPQVVTIRMPSYVGIKGISISEDNLCF